MPHMYIRNLHKKAQFDQRLGFDANTWNYAKLGRLISRLTCATANPLNRLGTVPVSEFLSLCDYAAAS
jgi:hypothetical protein